MDNGTDKDAWGEKKLNAWSWFLSNYGIVIFFSTIMIIAGSIAMIDAPLAGIAVAIGIIDFAAIGIYAPKWYKRLVEGNYIKTFGNSNFWDIFKHNK
jgi:uncharacterized membrane protein (DUF485 family)